MPEIITIGNISLSKDADHKVIWFADDSAWIEVKFFFECSNEVKHVSDVGIVGVIDLKQKDLFSCFWRVIKHITQGFPVWTLA